MNYAIPTKIAVRNCLCWSRLANIIVKWLLKMQKIEKTANFLVRKCLFSISDGLLIY